MRCVSFADVPEVLLFEEDARGGQDVPDELQSPVILTKQFIEACHLQFLPIGKLEEVCDYVYVADPAARECLVLFQFR